MTGKIRPAARGRGLGKVPISIPRPVHDQLTALKDQMTAELGRAVTYGEILEQLLSTWEKGKENR